MYNTNSANQAKTLARFKWIINNFLILDRFSVILVGILYFYPQVSLQDIWASQIISDHLSTVSNKYSFIAVITIVSSTAQSA